MTGFLGVLAGRSLGLLPVLRPRPPSRFEPRPAAPPGWDDFAGPEGSTEAGADADRSAEARSDPTADRARVPGGDVPASSTAGQAPDAVRSAGWSAAAWPYPPPPGSARPPAAAAVGASARVTGLPGLPVAPLSTGRPGSTAGPDGPGQVPGGPDAFEGAPGGPGAFEVVPGGPGAFEVALGGPGAFEAAPGGPGVFRAVPGGSGARRHPEAGSVGGLGPADVTGLADRRPGGLGPPRSQAASSPPTRGDLEPDGTPALETGRNPADPRQPARPGRPVRDSTPAGQEPTAGVPVCEMPIGGPSAPGRGPVSGPLPTGPVLQPGPVHVVITIGRVELRTTAHPPPTRPPGAEPGPVHGHGEKPAGPLSLGEYLTRRHEADR